MKTRKILTAALVCAMIAAAAGCGGNNAATATTAAQTTTTTAAETTTTTTAAETTTTTTTAETTTTTTATETTTTTTAAETTTEEEEEEAEEAEEEEDPMEFTAPLFTKGVWEAYSGDELGSYFVFFDETKGVIIDVEEKMATEFTCEQNGTEIIFFLGDGGMEVKADFSPGDVEGIFHFGTGDKVYSFAATDTEDPEAFAVNYLSGSGEASAALFPAGVWSASYEGELEGYYVFFDETNGTYIDVEMKAGTPFTCEQNGTEVLFDYGGGYTVKADFAPGEAQGIFHYDAIDKAVDIEYVADADPAAFAAEYGASRPAIFKRGVWIASVDGEISCYFVFDDETSGSIINPDLLTGVPFACEQNGTDILFHIASADDNTTATVDKVENTITFTYENGSVVTYLLDGLNDDPDEFMAIVGQ